MTPDGSTIIFKNLPSPERLVEGSPCGEILSFDHFVVSRFVFGRDDTLDTVAFAFTNLEITVTVGGRGNVHDKKITV